MYFSLDRICSSELEPPQGRQLLPWGYWGDLLPFSLYRLTLTLPLIFSISASEVNHEGAEMIFSL